MLWILRALKFLNPASASDLNDVTDRHALKVVSMVALALMTSFSIYGAFFHRIPTAGQTQIAVSDLKLTGTSSNASISMVVKNLGARTVNLAGHVLIAFAPSITFTPSRIGPDEVALGVALVSCCVAEFDGLSGLVTVPDSVSLNPSALTIEVGFKYNGHAPDQQMIFSKGSAGNDSFYFYTFRSAGNVNDFVVYNNGIRYDQQLGNIFLVDSWYSVSFTLNGTSISAYVNGVPVKSWNHAVLFRGNLNDLLLGKCSCGGYYFNGSIAFFRTYGRALSASEVQQNYLSPASVNSGSALLFNFNQEPGTTITDISGNGNNGTIGGHVSFVPLLEPCNWYSVEVSASTDNGVRYSVSQSAQVTC